MKCKGRKIGNIAIFEIVMMQNRTFKDTFLLLIILLTPLVLKAQYSTEGLNLSSSVSQWYDENVGLENTPLLYGSYKNVSRASSITHPFYLRSIWTKGDIQYRDQVFTNINLLYDIFDDELIIQHPTDPRYAAQPIRLNQSQVSWFMMDNLKFKYYQLPQLDTGFYQELYLGDRLDLVAKRIKTGESSHTNFAYIFNENHRYYIRLDQDYHRVYNIRTFIKLFPENKKEIRQYVNRRRLAIKTGKDRELIQLVSFCDHLDNLTE